MTNLQEAKLAREAEICYATIALVTDYDCWHPDHDQVTVEMIIANLTRERADGAAGDRRRRRRGCPSSARATARARWPMRIITRRDMISEAVKRDLAPIVGKYL